MARNFNELRTKMSPASQKASRLKADKYRSEMALNELRTARLLTQESLAAIFGVRQSAISKLERRTDMYISTLRGIIQAMGGSLRIEAVFPDGSVEISQFKEQGSKADEDLAKAG